MMRDADAIFRAMGHKKQQRRRVGRPEQVAEQGGAVRISPLQVVDPYDERPRVREPSEQFAESHKATLPCLDRVCRCDGPHGRRDPRDARQDGKEPHQRPEVAW